MKRLLVTTMLALLALYLCSCSNGSSAVDCGSLQTTVGSAALVVSPSGDSSYTVQGTGMDGVAGIQLDITYDAASLANPTVTQGDLVAGAMVAANTSHPGVIKIVIVSARAFSGSGQIATISFASKTGSGGITSITTGMIDRNGMPLSAQSNTSVKFSSYSDITRKNINKTVGAAVSLSTSSDSSYTVQGTEMNGVAGIQLDITYDAASLANPTVTQGGLVAGAMFAANTSRPGVIKIAIISSSAFSGSGQIAAISFATKTGSGGIISLASSMINSTGSQLPIQAGYSSVAGLVDIISSPAPPFSAPASSVPTSVPSSYSILSTGIASTVSASCQ
ncbi:MAG: cohesin domain-containing protein [Pelobacteraceae bacterium]